MYWLIKVSCNRCTTKLHIESFTKVTGSKEIHPRYFVGAVCGPMATGRGHRFLNEILASMNVPCMTKMKIEIQNIGKEWLI